MENKLCKICIKEKPLNEMVNNKTSKDGYLFKCILCKKEEFKKYYNLKKEILAIKNKKYYEDNRKVIIEQRKNYSRNNKDVINKYKKNRRENPLFRLKDNTVNMISKSIRKGQYIKSQKTEQILGCSYIEFKIHIESKFEGWMNWDNYGNPKDGVLELNKTWDIDHIIPLSSATTELELLKLNHYSNLQPLCSYTNRCIKKNIML